MPEPTLPEDIDRLRAIRKRLVRMQLADTMDPLVNSHIRLPEIKKQIASIDCTLGGLEARVRRVNQGPRNGNGGS